MIYRSLKFLNFSFDISIGNSNLEIKWLPESDYTEKLRNSHKKDFYERFNKHYESYNPISSWLSSESPAKEFSFVNFEA